MAKKKAIKTKKNTKMRRTVLGALSGVFMVSALIVAAIPSSTSKAVDPDGAQQLDPFVQQLQVKLKKDNIEYTNPSDAVVTAANTAFRNPSKFPAPSAPTASGTVYTDRTGALKLQKDSAGNGIVVGYNGTPSAIDIPAKTMTFDAAGGQAMLDSSTPLYKYTSTTVPDDPSDPASTTRTEYTVTPLYNTDAGYNIDTNTGAVTFDSGFKVCKEDVSGAISANSTTYSDVLPENIPTYSVTAIGGPNGGGQGVFEGCPASTYTLGNQLKYIGDRAFAGTRALRSIDMPDSVEYVGNYVFFNSALNTYSGGNLVKSYGTGAFAKSSIGTFTFGGSNQAIGPFCFADCSSLNAVEIGCLTYLGDGAFYKCNSLARLEMGPDVTDLSDMDYLAYGCENMASITLPRTSGNFHYTNLTGCQRLKKATFMSDTIIPDCGTKFADAITGLDNPYDDHSYDNFSGTSGGADVDCFGPINLGIFSENPREYYDNIFSDFVIHGNHLATTAGNDYNYAINHGIAYEYVGDDGNDKIEIYRNDYTYILEPQTSSVLTDIKKGTSTPTLNAMIMPGKIGPYPVTGVELQSMHALSDTEKKAVEYVEIPISFTSIGTNTFNGFEGLRTVKFDEAMNIQTIGDGAFKTGYSYTTTPDKLRFLGKVSKDGVVSEPYNYAMNVNNYFNDDTGGDRQYITYCTEFPSNQEIQLTYQTDPVTHQLTGVQRTLVSLPKLESPTTYSYDPLNKDKENGIASSAATLFLANPTMSVDEFTKNLTVAEQEVVNACTRPEIPYGVTAYAYTPSADGTSPAKSVFNNDGAGNNNLVSVIMNSIKSIGEGTFEGCTELARVEMRSAGDGEGEKIGDNAFKGCDKLATVLLPNTLAEMGAAPFRDCASLTGNGVDLGNGGAFSIANDIIYQDTSTGKKIVECLPNRGNDGTSNLIGTQDATGVSEVAPLAFYNCKYLKEADLSATTVKKLPDSAFENAEQLQKCALSDKIKNIGKDAFKNTQLYEITIPGMGVALDTDAFDQTKPLKLRGYVNSGVDSYAEDYRNYTFEEIKNVCLLSFVDTMAESPDKAELGTKMVENGSTLGEQVNYNPPVHEGYTFVGWDPEDYYSRTITGNMTIKTVYESTADATYPVEYYIEENDAKPFYKETVARDGFAVGPPAAVMRAVETAKPGYEFIGWDPSNFASVPITKAKKVVAQYVYTGVFTPSPSPSGSVSGDTPSAGPSTSPSDGPGGGGGTPGTPGGTTATTVPSTTPDTDTNDSGSSSSDNEGSSGSNSGNNNNSGGNSGSNNNGGSNNNSNSNNSNNSNNGNNGNNNSGNNGGGNSVSSNTTTTTNRTNTVTTGGSAIHVTKSGISNTGVAGVNVNGSTDNYVVKVSDSEEARSLAQQALLGEYGNLDSIKYFAMDISLYDSTGTTKLENEIGVSVDVTIPIPDALAEYGGNNMIGSVKGGQLEKLNNRFTTIDGVPCMTFTATHFSPYVVYVDTNNLTASGMIDATPKTADPLEPKWFLAIGLALLSILTFLLRGPKNKIILAE